MQWLLEKGAGVDARDYGRYPEYLTELLKTYHKAGVNATDLEGRTPFFASVEGGMNIEIAQKLYEAGADVDMKDIEKNAPIHLAVNANHLEMVQWLIQVGANVNAQEEFGYTPLLRAVDRKHIAVLKQLIDAGADVNMANELGHAPIHTVSHVSDAESIEILQLLIKAGADVNAPKDIEYRHQKKRIRVGYTPLYIAARIGNIEAIHQLLEAGADVNMANELGHTPLDVAKQYRHLHRGIAGYTAYRRLLKVLKNAETMMPQHPPSSSCRSIFTI